MYECKSAIEAENTPYMMEWKDKMYKALVLARPEMTTDMIVEVIDSEFREKFKNPKAFLYNNVKMKDIIMAEKNFSMGLLEVVEFIRDNKPILTESGCMFRQHSEQINPVAKVLWKWKAERNKFKKVSIKAFEEGDVDKYQIFDLMQSGKKVNMNSYYGASGLKTSVMYNLHTAESITLKGQRIIASSATSMDAFMSNNTPFMHIEEFFTFIDRVREQKYSVDIMKLISHGDFIPTTKDIATKLYEGFHKNIKDRLSYSEIYSIVTQLPESLQYKLYYKNNLYAVLLLNKVQEKLKTIMLRLEGWNMEDGSFFIDPNEAPDCIRDEMEFMYIVCHDMVLFNHMTNQRVDRLKHEPRASVVTIDTDSNMLNVDPFYKFIKYVIMEEDTLSFDPDVFRFNAVNIISCILTRIINDVMYEFTITSNIEDHDMRLLVNMKNEFLFKVFLTTDAKKNYVGLIELKEGTRPKTPKMDIKGLQIRKSSVNVHVRDELSDILEYDIMKADSMNVPSILRKITSVEHKIKESLLNGDKRFCTPGKVKDPRGYAKPLQQGGFRGYIVWNILNPDHRIELPSKIYTLKLNITKPAHFRDLEVNYPEEWAKLQILFGDDAIGDVAEYFKDKGITILSIPSDVEELPEWTKNFICYDEIVTSSTKVMLPVLKSLTLTTAKSGQMSTFSNIVQL
ncbi:MAG: family B DNA polymerase [Fusobacteriaceae bacterium]